MPMNPRLLRPLARRQAPPPPPPCTYPASLLLRFDEDFTDSSVNGLTVTAEGDVAISTTEKKFGSGSAAFDGFSHATIGTGLLDIARDDFTVEAWIYPEGVDSLVGGTWAIFHFNAGDTSGLHIHRTDAGFLQVDNGQEGTDFGDVFIPPGEWSHIAVTRSLSVIRGFVNGVQCLSHQSQQYAIATQLQLARYSLGGIVSNFGGYIDDLRIVEGLAVYDGDFVPPSSALPSCATPYTTYKPYGTFLFSECDGSDLVGTYANGSGGRYTEVISEGTCE